MAIFQVVRYPDPVLLKATEEVASIGEREKILIRDMIDTMYAEKGVGLAANQIGVARRVFIALPDEKAKPIAFINPRIIRKSGVIIEQEGCLSLPGHYEKVRRFSKVTLAALTPEGKSVEVEAEGLLARIFQHETDHLDGYVYLHRLGFLKRHRLLKRLSKPQTEAGARAGKTG